VSACFADTSYFLALLIRDDEYHERAVRWASTSNRPLLTTEYVAMEVANFLAATPARSLFGALLETLGMNPRSTLVRASPDLFRRGVELYLQRLDKSWSLTDCTSFVVMHERKLTDALTADYHFEQAGFAALLRA
jgi:hypothetical protein